MTAHEHITIDDAKSYIDKLTALEVSLDADHNRNHLILICETCRETIANILLQQVINGADGYPEHCSLIANSNADTERYMKTKLVALKEGQIPKTREKAQEMLTFCIRMANKLKSLHDKKTTERMFEPSTRTENNDRLIKACDEWYSRTTSAITFLKVLLGQAIIMGDEEFLEEHKHLRS